MTQTPHKTDHALKTTIEDELAWAPNVRADRIGVAVNDGSVLLSGEVDSYPEKEAAVNAALRVRNVTAVADEIFVEHSARGPREDADIARDASTTLERSTIVPNTVKATVHNHLVTLSGTVAWQFQREAARRAVGTIPGVATILNTINLKPPVTVSPAEAKAKITSAIMRNAQLDANRISVTVHGSQVDLSGIVTSWGERRQAEHAAWSAPGVTDVVNHLVVHSTYTT